MDTKLIDKIVAKGKLLLKRAASSPPKSHSELIDICEGLTKTPNHEDSLKLLEDNPYFAPSLLQSDLPPLLILTVGFHNKEGTIIEGAYPESCALLLQSPEYEGFGRKVCFAVIPDCAHELEVVWCVSVERLWVLHRTFPVSTVVWRHLLQAA
eukprot:TRINITY_DN1226_c1_g1_i1.p1 TRINITY_DN1226_c1_g1~~TRINITY_DN1226_c1_g1_i1.p1  ORF type:complete len:153 (+),score=16.26 TRINITY_DN1226_c1_g1_i1:67-525(+)